MPLPTRCNFPVLPAPPALPAVPPLPAPVASALLLLMEAITEAKRLLPAVPTCPLD